MATLSTWDNMFTIYLRQKYENMDGVSGVALRLDSTSFSWTFILTDKYDKHAARVCFKPSNLQCLFCVYFSDMSTKFIIQYQQIPTY